MQCKRLTWENEGPGLFDIWLVCVKTQTDGSFARQLVSLLVDKEHCAAKHSFRQPTLGREGWVFRHIRLGTEMPFAFHAEFDETKIDFRMLRNSRENEGFRFRGCWRGACPRWFCVALAVGVDGEGMAGVWRARSIPSSSRTCGLGRRTSLCRCRPCSR